MNARRTVRALFLVVIVGSALYLGLSYAESPVREETDRIQRAHATNATEPIVPPRDSATAIVSDRRFQGLTNSAMMVFAADGSLDYYGDSFSNYHDVDRSPAGRRTLFVTVSDFLPESRCPSDHPCTRNSFQLVDRTTGANETLYANLSTKEGSRDWHDADRINATHYVVADIERDRVFIVDTATDEITWQWRVKSSYNNSSGGAYPSDWTHMNDVEYLPDGRIMASLRNHDQVVFVEPGRGLIEDWTLGTDDDHATLFEAHNPDYIPASAGGPAVLIADSENDRVIEYQHVGGEWKASWVWSDPRMEWPRDADRLPNGHTLITDSNAGRVFEVDRRGTIVWEVNVSMPYEAERLGTADESGGGRSAVAAGLTASVDGEAVSREQIGAATYRESTETDGLGRIDDRLRGKSFHYLWSLSTSGLLFITPEWVAVPQLLALVALGASVLVWALTEGYWLVADARRGRRDPHPW